MLTIWYPGIWLMKAWQAPLTVRDENSWHKYKKEKIIRLVIILERRKLNVAMPCYTFQKSYTQLEIERNVNSQLQRLSKGYYIGGVLVLLHPIMPRLATCTLVFRTTILMRKQSYRIRSNPNPIKSHRISTSLKIELAHRVRASSRVEGSSRITPMSIFTLFQTKLEEREREKRKTHRSMRQRTSCTCELGVKATASPPKDSLLVNPSFLKEQWHPQL